MKSLKQILLTNKVELSNITKALNINSPDYLLYNTIIEKSVDEIINLLVLNGCTDIPLRTLIKPEGSIKAYIIKRQKEKTMQVNDNSNVSIDKGIETIQQLRENNVISRLIATIEQQSETIKHQSSIIAKQLDIITTLTNKRQSD